MKQSCAFCPNLADSREHIWSDWINKILPNTRFRFTRVSDTGVSHRWEKRVLDVTAPVVCQQCNNGWMSDFEEKQAKPAITDLILADKLVKLSPERLKSIAYFAFKTAVVGDHTSLPERAPFFSTAERFAFRERYPRFALPGSDRTPTAANSKVWYRPPRIFCGSADGDVATVMRKFRFSWGKMA
jgi:hypothetical protein